MPITTSELERVEAVDLEAVTGGCKRKDAPPAPPPPSMSGGDQVSISVNGQTQTATG